MNPLAQLRDIHVPQAISWWPLAVGWYMLIFLSLLVIVGLTIWSYNYWRMNRPRREVLEKLGKLKQQYAREEDRVAIAVEISTLLRRATLAMFPRSEVANLQSEAWLQFLDNTGNTKAFTQGAGRILITAPYQSQAKFAADELFAVIDDWINAAMKRVRR